MAYIVLALGVLMALVGLGAMATGYPVIEIERGWATVIAGSVLLSGGVVTAALGIVVRSLAGLRSSTKVEISSADAALAAPATAASPFVPAQPPLPATAASSPARSAIAAGVPAAAMAAAAVAAESSPARAAPAVDTPPAAAPEPAYEAPAYEGPAPGKPAREELGHEEPAHEAALEAIPPHAWEASEAHDQPLEPEPMTQEHPNDPAQARPPTGHGDDPLNGEAWLDQAFQAFDYEMTGGHPPPSEEPARLHAMPEATEADTHPEVVAHDEPPPRPAVLREPHAASEDHTAHDHAPREASGHLAPAHEEPASEEPPNEQHAHREHAHQEPVAAHEPAAEAPTTAPEAPSNLAVIGRYDSEGTSYVMYSDGSIEAQSEAGIYRFGSMAELKAFIEG